MMHYVPARVQQPTDTDEIIMLEGFESHKQHNSTKNIFPDAQSAAPVNTACTGNDDGVDFLSRWLPHKRHDDDKYETNQHSSQCIGDCKFRNDVRMHIFLFFVCLQS